MKVALLYPPTCDPTAPYLALPTLSGWLRAHGHEVLPIDANLEGWEHLLSKAELTRLGQRVAQRRQALERQPALAHGDQLAYAALLNAAADAHYAPGAIEEALSVFRDRERFYRQSEYAAAVRTVESAQRLISAAYTPLGLDFVAYRTPFSLMNPAEIERDAAPDRDPFHAAFLRIAERVRREGCPLVGLSVAFPGQIQPAFSLAYTLRRELPGVYLTVGGPALTQMLLRLKPEALQRALGPFDSAVAYEGEFALLELIEQLERGERPRGLIKGRTVEDMSQLPGPDFEGLPLDRYLAPELVLPYDPTRGCYYGVCTFCHYGLAEVGTARHRERPVEQVLDQLSSLQQKHGTRIFYFSQDAFAPKIAGQIARGIAERGLSIRWGTDMRPERSLSPERCAEFVQGGALSAALGVESAAPRVLSLIDKGIKVEDMRRVIENLSQAGMAVEAMCFSDFPTESYREALATIDLVRQLTPHLSLFILGRFDLTHGSLVAQKPGEFGIKEVWHIEGDELQTGLFFQERQQAKSERQRAQVESLVAELSSRWSLRRYPWAGALSTAHTLLWYERFGKGVFRELAELKHSVQAASAAERAAAVLVHTRFDVQQADEQSAAHEAEIWQELVQNRRKVTRPDYDELAARAPRLRPAAGSWRCALGATPERVPGPAQGRRQSHAPNAAQLHASRRPAAASKSAKLRRRATP
ncbi:MAG TPA: radical SAM protein [Polyangiaceae bacterium]|nr:radical SAM protein [Polyangiaceae bacterium]